jgi:putative redox protein
MFKMATVKTQYKGSLSTSTNYVLSENPILTKASSFGPTDLFTVSLSTCIATYIDFVAKKNGFTTDKVEVEIVKTMSADSTVVASFDVVVNFNDSFTNEQKEIIEKTSKTCPVGNSLHPDIKRTYVFNY